jgi:hypothetical protein
LNLEFCFVIAKAFGKFLVSKNWNQFSPGWISSSVICNFSNVNSVLLLFRLEMEL